MAARNTRLAVTFAVVVVLALAAFWGISRIWDAAKDHFTATECTIGEYTIDTEQAAVAAQMLGAVAKFRPKLPAKTGVLVLMAGLQESKLRNIPAGEGDRDSVGVLQQRPSQGWGGGDAAKLSDVTEATREFLAALITHPNWRTQELADAIQDVQISIDGSLYAQHEDEARALARALQGRVAAGISCTYDKPTVVAPTSKVVTQLRHQLPVNAPTRTTRTVTVPGAGWQTAAWFVANADRLGVDSVAYAGKRFTRADGWQDAPPRTGGVVATMATV